MSLHYSDEQALSSCVAKEKVLARFFEVAALHPQAAAVLDGNLPSLEAAAFDWKAFAALAHPSLPNQTLTSTPASSSSQAALPIEPAGELLPILDVQRKQDKKGKKKKEEKEKKGKKGKKDKSSEEPAKRAPAKRQRKVS